MCSPSFATGREGEDKLRPYGEEEGEHEVRPYAPRNGQKLTRDERPVRAELAVLGYGFLDEPRRPVEAG